MFRLRFLPAEIVRWAASFADPHTTLVDGLSRGAHARGVLTRKEFLALCRWKTPRTQPRCASNFCDTRPYPVLDYRALWSLGYPRPPAETFEFWSASTHCARALAQSTGHDMRTIDRALWQYSKHHQR